ncbi:MAG: hypothetical protein QXS23_01630 [Desulfurococcaceae archaeon]
MKPLVNSLLKDLEDLVNELRRIGISKADEEKLISLRDMVVNTKKPSILTQDLLASYYTALSTVTEALIAIRNLKDYLSISIIIDKVKENIREFAEVLGKAYRREKIQLNIPIYLGLFITLVNLMSEPGLQSLIPTLLALLALSMSWINVYIGLSIVLVISAVNILVFGLYVEVLFTNILLALSAIMYMYIIYMSHSHRYAERLNLAVESMRAALISKLKPIDRDDVLDTLYTSNVDNNKVIHSMLSELVDNVSLRRYKIAVMLMNGLSIYHDHKT